MKILVLTAEGDQSADVVIKKLKAHQAEVVRFDLGDFPARASISYTHQRGKPAVTFTSNSGSYRLDEFHSIWLRKPFPPQASSKIADPQLRKYIRAESQVFLYDCLESSDAFWLPCTYRQLMFLEDNRLHMLRTAEQIGFAIPPTLVTNCRKDFLEFYREHKGKVIIKKFRSMYLGPEDESGRRPKIFSMYTSPIERFMTRDAHLIQYCPVVIQEYVPKESELRVTVVGDQVFAAEIRSQETYSTRHDWRRYDLGNTPHFPYALPDEIAGQCRALLKQFGLSYGAIDMVLTPQNEYVFLEINPGGQYQWIEDLTRLPISQAICDQLLKGKSL